MVLRGPLELWSATASFLTLACFAFSAAGADAEAVSAARSADALLNDLSRIVDAEDSTGWLIDEAAYREIYPDLMDSVCRATKAVRKLALERLERARRAYGDPHAAYLRAGSRLDSKAEDALKVTRLTVALRKAIAGVDTDCPFWIEPSPDFRGRQSVRESPFFSLETGGVVQIRRTAGDYTLGGGGAGRLLLGYGFTDVSMLFGIEFGGSAMIQPNTEPTQFVVNYLPAIPFILRFHDLAFHYDIEVAPVGLFQADQGDLSYGLRAGFNAGLSALRTRGLLPWAGLGVATEYYLESGGRPSALFLRWGLRVGAVWDL